MAGIFITFEGIDGSGKSCLAKALFNDLKNLGHRIRFVPVIGYGPIDNAVTHLLDHKKHYDAHAHFLLSTASSRVLMKTVIIPGVDQGKIVILDRYYFSSLAYSQPSKISEEWMLEVVKSLIPPDIIIFPQTDIEKAYKRKRNFVGIETGFSEGDLSKGFLEFQTQVLDAYNYYFKKLGIPVVSVDNNRDFEFARNEVLERVLTLINKKKAARDVLRNRL